jgi:8-oxo-dGTP diphosphatase
LSDPNKIESGRNLLTLSKFEREAMTNDERSRTYPTRPYLAVSAAIFRYGRVLIVRRARAPANGLYTLPGGGVELGETLEEAVVREVREETSLEVKPVALAGYRQAITRDAQGDVERHFVILPFATRWVSGEVSLNEELGEAYWLEPSAIANLKTTEGLTLIVQAARECLAAAT